MRDRYKAVRETFGDEKGTKDAALRGTERRTKDVAPVNFRGVLLRDRKGGAPRAAMAKAAWSLFLSRIRDAAPQYPLSEAWERTRDLASLEGWRWPSRPTVMRRWNELPEAERHALRHGITETVKQKRLPAKRDPNSLEALQFVSLDGRKMDLMADFGDGKPVRPQLLALVDCTSGVVLAWEIDRSENALAVRRLLLRAVEEWGCFETLYPDNSLAFSAKLITGSEHGSDRKRAIGQPRQPGLKDFMLFALTWAKPGNGQTKLAERVFRDMAKKIEAGPEFRGAHTGNKPGARPGPITRPVPIEELRAIAARHIARLDAEPGRRGRTGGKSRIEALRDGIAARVLPPACLRGQALEDARRVWVPASVDRFGQITVNGWTYGDNDSCWKLLTRHKQDRVIFGYDPDDFSVPGVVMDADCRIILRGMQPREAGDYTDAAGARKAAAEAKALRRKIEEGFAAHDLLSRREAQKMLAKVLAPEPHGAPDAVHPSVIRMLPLPVRPAADEVAAAEDAGSEGLPGIARALDLMEQGLIDPRGRRMVVGGRPLTPEAAPDVAPDAWSRGIEMLARGLIRFPSRWDDD